MIPLDLLSAEFERDTHQAYRKWRTEWGAKLFPAQGACVVIDYATAASVIKDARRFSSSVFEPLTSPLLHAADAPHHTEIRKAVSSFFSPSRQAEAAESISRIASAAADRGLKAGRLKVLADFAAPVPLDVACHWFGINQKTALLLLSQGTHAARWKTVKSGIVEGGMLFELNRTGVLPPDEMAQLTSFFMSAAVTTTRDFLWLSMRTLALNPHAIEGAKTDPGSIGGLVDELLRLEPPAHALIRRTRCDVNLGECDVPEGTLVWISLAAANRDPLAFERPDEIVVERSGPRHLTFGIGPHFCLGSQIGKMIGEASFRVLLPMLRPASLAKAVPALRFDRRTELPIMWQPAEWEIPIGSA